MLPHGASTMSRHMAIERRINFPGKGSQCLLEEPISNKAKKGMENVI